MGENQKPGAFARLILDFQPVPRVFLCLGFAIFLIGVPAGFRLDNRVMMIGVALIAAGLAGHYWPEVTFAPIYMGDVNSGGVRWGNLALALLFSALCVLTCLCACFGQ
jgi:hypothetical protein